MLAISLGGLLIVPPFVSWFRTFGRIETAQEIAGVPERVSPGVGFVLFILALFFLPFEIVYAQRHLNRLWRHELGRRAA